MRTSACVLVVVVAAVVLLVGLVGANTVTVQQYHKTECQGKYENKTYGDNFCGPHNDKAMTYTCDDDGDIFERECDAPEVTRFLVAKHGECVRQPGATSKRFFCTYTTDFSNSMIPYLGILIATVFFITVLFLSKTDKSKNRNKTR